MPEKIKIETYLQNHPVLRFMLLKVSIIIIATEITSK